MSPRRTISAFQKIFCATFVWMMCWMQALDLQIIVVFSVINDKAVLCLGVSTSIPVWCLALLEWRIPCTARKHVTLHLNNYAEYAGSPVCSILRPWPFEAWCSAEVRLALLLSVGLPRFTVMAVRFGFLFAFFSSIEIQDAACLHCRMQIKIIFKTYSTLHIQNIVETFAVILTTPWWSR